MRCDAHIWIPSEEFYMGIIRFPGYMHNIRESHEQQGFYLGVEGAESIKWMMKL